LGNSLTFCINGGASINKQTTQLMNGLGYCMHQGYGMTETGIVSVELSKYACKRNASTLGKPFKNIN
jgi:long-subunit acyl-CoA synthetase (AMP-forming)